MSLRAARICGCGYRIASGEQCPCQRARAKQRDASRPSAHKRGYTKEWDKEAKTYIAQNPTCRRCGAPSQCVDHIQPHKGNQRLFWNRSNWQSLCIPCNSRKNVKEEGGFGNKRGVDRNFERKAGDHPRPKTHDRREIGIFTQSFKEGLK